MNKKGMFHGIGALVMVGILVVVFMYFSDGGLDFGSFNGFANNAKSKVTGFFAGLKSSDYESSFKTANIQTIDLENPEFRKEYVATYAVYYGPESPEINDILRRYSLVIIKPENFNKLPYNAICVVNDNYADWRLAGCNGFYVDSVNGGLEELKSIDVKTIIVEHFSAMENIHELTDFVLFEDFTTNGMNVLRSPAELEANKVAARIIKSSGKRVLTLDYTTKELFASNSFANARSVGAIPFTSETDEFDVLK